MSLPGPWPKARCCVGEGETALRFLATELLPFRHRVRNLYAFQLDEAKVVEIAESVPGAWTSVRADLVAFAARLTPVL